jgi:hypothetical protein
MGSLSQVSRATVFGLRSLSPPWRLTASRPSMVSLPCPRLLLAPPQLPAGLIILPPEATWAQASMPPTRCFLGPCTTAPVLLVLPPFPEARLFPELQAHIQPADGHFPRNDQRASFVCPALPHLGRQQFCSSCCSHSNSRGEAWLPAFFQPSHPTHE